MPRGHAAFTVPEILDRSDENFGIPYDGEGSDISSEYSGPDIDTDQAVLGCETASIDQKSEVLDNLHVVELADEEEIGSTEEKNETCTGRIPAFYDFSKAKWRMEKTSNDESEEDESDGEEEPVIYCGEFSQQVGPVSVLSSAAIALDFFFLMCAMNIVNNILCETNKYAFHSFTAAG